jgi:menaquinone-specific isochorismate synthase
MILNTQTHSDLELGLTDAILRSKAEDSSILFSYTFQFEARDLLPLLSHPADKNACRIYWEQPQEGFALAGLGKVLEINFDAGKSSDCLNEIIGNYFEKAIHVSNQAFAGPRFLGGHSFNPQLDSDDTWDAFPRACYILPECLATLNLDGCWLTISKMVTKNDNHKSLLREFSRNCIHYEKRLPVTLPPLRYVPVDKYKDIPNRKEYDEIIYSVLEEIRPEKLEKVVISRSHQVKVGEGFSVVSAVQVLRNIYPKCTNFFFSFPKAGIFFGATPERLIRKKDQQINTEALAGTIARGRNMEEDRLLAETLFDSHKEREEHRFVIEQIKGRLETIVPELDIAYEPQILKLRNVQHLKTPISAKLENDENIIDLVKLLHPTPAVAGTPMKRAMEVIRKFESHDRGWYSGPVGWIDPKGDGDFFVALRSALVKDEEAHIFVGGGIVSESLPEQEWHETELKLQPIISALSGGQI